MKNRLVDYAIFDGTKQSISNMWPMQNAAYPALIDGHKKIVCICTKHDGIQILTGGEYLVRDNKGNVSVLSKHIFDARYDIIT